MNADNRTSAWKEAQDGFVRRALRLDPQTLGLVGWLAGRWHLPPEAVAAEVLALALLGRLRRERLKADGALQGRWSVGGGDSHLILHWPVACEEALAQRAARCDRRRGRRPRGPGLAAAPTARALASRRGVTVTAAFRFTEPDR